MATSFQKLTPIYVNAVQLAEAIPCSRRTIDVWKNQGFLPHVKIGRTIRYDLDEVRAALEKRFKVKVASSKK
jgi:hypothetical protein